MGFVRRRRVSITRQLTSTRSIPDIPFRSPRPRHGAMRFWERPCAELSQCYWRSALACTSVFRGKLARWLRIGAFLEGPLTTLRALQSGHPG